MICPENLASIPFEGIGDTATIKPEAYAPTTNIQRTPFRRLRQTVAAAAAIATLSGCGAVREYLPHAEPAETYALCQRWQDNPSYQDSLEQSIANTVASTLIRPNGFAPGAVVEVGCGNTTLASVALGETGAGPGNIATETPNTNETLYDLSSVSKPFTAMGIFLLARNGLITSLDEPIGDFLPMYRNGDKSMVTFRTLLQHRSGLEDPSYSSVAGADPSAVYSNIMAYPLSSTPGAEYHYSNFGYSLLYIAGSVASGMNLADYIRNNLTEPLNMDHTGYYPYVQDCAPTSPDENQTEVLRCIPQDKLARDEGGVSGHAGWFSTGNDMARFIQGILQGRVLSQQEVQLVTTPVGSGYATGMMINSDNRFSNYMSTQTFGHIGANGTGFFVDPNSGMWSVILTNGTYLAPAPDGKTDAFRAINDTFASISNSLPA